MELVCRHTKVGMGVGVQFMANFANGL